MVKNGIHYCIYIIVRLLICTIQAMRIETAIALARPIAWLANDVLRIRAGVMQENLRHAFPELTAQQRQRLARDHWLHLLIMVIEIAHAQRKIHLTNWRQHIRFHRKREMLSQLLGERPTVLVSGHFGNFEVGGQVLGLFGLPTFTVARPLDNPYLDRFVNSFRSSNGQLILAKSGSAERVETLLTDGGSLVVLGDQSAGPKGIWTDFFGRPAATHKAIALFSLGFEAPLMVTYTKRVGHPLRFELGCEGIADPSEPDSPASGPRELTAWFTSRLEDAVRQAPEQYWWLHRRWKNPDKWKTRRERRRRKQAA